MPTANVKKYAEESGKSIEEVEAFWEDCKASADKKFKDKDASYWSWVNNCTRAKCGLLKPSSESVLARWVPESNV